MDLSGGEGELPVEEPVQAQVWKQQSIRPKGGRGSDFSSLLPVFLFFHLIYRY